MRPQRWRKTKKKLAKFAPLEAPPHDDAMLNLSFKTKEEVGKRASDILDEELELVVSDEAGGEAMAKEGFGIARKRI